MGEYFARSTRVAIASDMAVRVKTGARSGDSATERPAKMLAITRTNPMAEHSSTLPGRQKRRYRPIKIAIGMVALFVPVPLMFLGAIVIVVQTLVFSLLTSIYIGLATEHEEH